MTILIDTQVVIWLGDASPKLGSTARRLLEDTSNRILVSYFSFFEIAIEAATGKGKIAYNDSVFDDMTATGIEVVYPSRDQLKNYRLYNSNNKDPYDNILLAVTETEQAALMTSDAKILATRADQIDILDARL